MFKKFEFEFNLIKMNSCRKMRICVVGAGTAGLAAVKHSLAQDFDVVCYDKGNAIGGQWVYTDPTGIKCEQNVHSSIYEELRTNVPKEMMAYPDFEYPSSLKQSFISATDVLKYHQSYAKHFQLESHIHLNHEVLRIRPSNGRWQVHVLNTVTKELDVQEFDFVFICNGRFVTPFYASIKDWEQYQGKRMHSHTYRKAEDFKDDTVLIIGAGRSGMDLTNHIRKTAKHVYLSHHVTPPPRTDFMPNVTQKPIVQHFTASGAVFSDGSAHDFSVVIYCTGFIYSAPFLSADCGLYVDENAVYPLYKHCININHPTMAFIGLQIYIFSGLSDLQVRFALEYFSGRKTLPSREEMLTEIDAELAQRKANGERKWLTHEIHNLKLNNVNYDYYKDLAETADIAPIKPVIFKVMENTFNKYLYELDTFRETVYEFVDNENFIIHPNVDALKCKI
ncbi:senecionine N-oxygenase-like isoform X1 [Anastrepha obliqua]|uniref:senecionine N-oxygenase-like isoform X1 n=2 Tax=Anastrepha obliqua TaxID=95512 RepID=UPI002409447B|nr:senecionine N-oxygenase-like isoform X1 [Anastrepha obliqua]